MKRLVAMLLAVFPVFVLAWGPLDYLCLPDISISQPDPTQPPELHIGLTCSHKPYLNGIGFAVSSATVEVGQTQVLTVNRAMSDGSVPTAQVTCISSNPAVAGAGGDGTNCTVAGVAAGTVTITASAESSFRGMMTAAMQVTVPQPVNPMVAAYAFNEGTNAVTADASGHELTGTLTNGAGWGAGKYGAAVSLDGVDDYVALGNPAGLQLTGSMTVSAWINSTSFPGDDAAIVSKRGLETEGGYQFDTTVDTGPRTIGFKLNNGAGGNMFRYGVTAMTAGVWYHVAGVYNAATGTMNVYLNGQLDNGAFVGTADTTQKNSGQNVKIGQRASGGFGFIGLLDDVRIYDRALTQAEIQTDMNTPLP